jgi:hypothetical protein
MPKSPEVEPQWFDKITGMAGFGATWPLPRVPVKVPSPSVIGHCQHAAIGLREAQALQPAWTSPQAFGDGSIPFGAWSFRSL